MKSKKGSVSVTVLFIVLVLGSVWINSFRSPEVAKREKAEVIAERYAEATKGQHAMSIKMYSDMTDKEKLAYDNQHLND
jgi:hypothetical protein